MNLHIALKNFILSSKRHIQATGWHTDWQHTRPLITQRRMHAHARVHKTRHAKDREMVSDIDVVTLREALLANVEV